MTQKRIQRQRTKDAAKLVPSPPEATAGHQSHRQSVEKGRENMSVWVTQLILKPHHRGLPYNSDQVHRLLAAATNSNRYLWAHPRPGMMIVQSHHPIITDIIERIAKQAHSQQRDLRFRVGSKVEIAGIVSPQRTETSNGVKRKRPARDDAVPGWLDRRFEGAAKVHAPLTIEHISPSKGSRPDGSQILHTRVSVHGYVTVIDGDRLSALLAEGVGPGKRFGTGLIQAREVR